MRVKLAQSLIFRMVGVVAALCLTSTLALAQPDSTGGGETPSTTTARPAATPPPSSTPAASPASTNPAPAAAAPAGGHKKNGLVYQFKIGGNLTTVASTGGTSAGWLNGGFMIGYKLGRLTLGLGIEVGYADYRAQAGGMDVEQSQTTVIFIPTIEFYLLQSSPLVLYLGAGVHGGFMNVHSDPGEDYTDGGVGFHVGVGMRYFVHPRFAVGLEGGFRGFWLFVENDDSTGDDDETYGIMSFYGALVVTAIW